MIIKFVYLCSVVPSAFFALAACMEFSSGPSSNNGGVTSTLMTLFALGISIGIWIYGWKMLDVNGFVVSFPLLFVPPLICFGNHMVRSTADKFVVDLGNRMVTGSIRRELKAENKSRVCELVRRDVNSSRAEQDACWAAISNEKSPQGKWKYLSQLLQERGTTLEYEWIDENNIIPRVPDEKQIWFVREFCQTLLDLPDYWKTAEGIGTVLDMFQNFYHYHGMKWKAEANQIMRSEFLPELRNRLNAFERAHPVSTLSYDDDLTLKNIKSALIRIGD